MVSIISIIVSVCKLKQSQGLTANKVIEKFEELRQATLNTKEYEELKAQLTIVHQENIELKRTINKLLTKIDYIARPEEE